MTVRIRPLGRGPLVVEACDGASIELFGVDGAKIDVSGARKVRLCRCGASAARPLCDGAHNRTKFEAPVSADEEVVDPDLGGSSG